MSFDSGRGAVAHIDTETHPSASRIQRSLDPFIIVSSLRIHENGARFGTTSIVGLYVHSVAFCVGHDCNRWTMQYQAAYSVQIQIYRSVERDCEGGARDGCVQTPNSVGCSPLTEATERTPSWNSEFRRATDGEGSLLSDSIVFSSVTKQGLAMSSRIGAVSLAIINGQIVIGT